MKIELRWIKPRGSHWFTIPVHATRPPKRLTIRGGRRFRRTK